MAGWLVEKSNFNEYPVVSLDLNLKPQTMNKVGYSLTKNFCNLDAGVTLNMFFLCYKVSSSSDRLQNNMIFVDN